MTTNKRVAELENTVQQLNLKVDRYELDKRTVLGAIATEILRLQARNETGEGPEYDLRENAKCLASLVTAYTELIKTLQL